MQRARGGATDPRRDGLHYSNAYKTSVIFTHLKGTSSIFDCWSPRALRVKRKPSSRLHCLMETHFKNRMHVIFLPIKLKQATTVP